MRRLLAPLVLLACASPAQAAPQPLGPAPHDFALAGDHVLQATVRGRTLRVAAEGQEVFTYQAPKGSVPSGRLAASPQRAALTVTLEDDTSEIAAAQAFSGPPAGPWAALTPMRRLDDGFVFPWQHQLDGERLFTSEFRGGFDQHAVVVRDPEPRELALPFDAVFAGDLVAYTETTPDQAADAIGRRLVVAEWRTGVRRGVTDLPEPIQQLALRADGRAAVTQDTLPGVYQVDLGGRPRRITRRTPAFDQPVVYAGDHLVFAENDRVYVDGRPFGTPTEAFGGFVADARRVAWVANGCLLVAGIGEPAARAPAPGPCPRSEISVTDDHGNVPLRRTIRVGLRCVAAPSRCRGTVRLQGLSRPRRYAVPAGHTREFVLRLTERGYRTVRATVARDGDAGVRIVAVGTDGDRASGGTLVLSG